MTQKEHDEQGRAIQALLYTFYAVVVAVVVVLALGIQFTGMEMVGLCAGAGIAYPFIYLVLGERK